MFLTSFSEIVRSFEFSTWLTSASVFLNNPIKCLKSFFVYFRLVDLCSLKRFEVEPKTLLDTSVDRRNYGIWESRNLSDLTQLWDLGLSNVSLRSLFPHQFSQTYFQNSTVEKLCPFRRYWFAQSKLNHFGLKNRLIKQLYSNPRWTCASVWCKFKQNVCQIFFYGFTYFSSLVR